MILADPAVSAEPEKKSYFSNLSHEEGRGCEKENHFTMSKSYPSRNTLGAHAGHLILSWTPQGPWQIPQGHMGHWSHTGQCQVVPDATWIPQRMSPGSMLDTLEPHGAPWIHAGHPPDTQQMWTLQSLCLKIYKNRYLLKNSWSKSHTIKNGPPHTTRTWNYFSPIQIIMWRYWYLFS